MATKQTELPGTERPAIPEIDEAADAYRSVRDKRMKLTEQEITAKTNLIEVMRANAKKLAVNAAGERIYRYDDEVVVLEPGKENVKVKHASAEPEGE